MLCSSERGCTVQVMAGDVNKAFIVETERAASKGMRQHLLGQACCQMKNKQANRERFFPYAALQLRWVPQHELLVRRGGDEQMSGRNKSGLRENIMTP